MLAAVILAAVINADAAFAAGNFDAAGAAYAAAYQADPQSLDAALGLTRVALYNNRLDDAAHWLAAAQAIAPADPHVRAEAGAIAQRSDTSIDTVGAHGGSSIVKFVQTDPLPVVAVRVNGHDAHFLIDTGAPNIVLDTHFAQSLGLELTAAGEGTFAGGKHAATMKTVVDRLDLGGLEIRNVPASVLPVPSIGMPVEGILGTALFAHFLTTLDYRNERLVLESRDRSGMFEASASAKGASIVPMWLVGDHFIFVRGRAGAGAEGLFNVDTGGTFGVQLTRIALDSAHILIDTSHAQSGIGGGGTVSVYPFTTSVSLGAYTVNDLDGVYFPRGNQYGIFPFTVTGTVSHQFFRKTALTFDFVAMRMVISTD